MPNPKSEDHQTIIGEVKEQLDALQKKYEDDSAEAEFSLEKKKGFWGTDAVN